MSARHKAESAPGPAVARRQALRVASRALGPSEDRASERLIYERVRLGIMSALAVCDELRFSELKALFDVSDGNLSAHARKLEEAQYLTCTKSFEGRRPKSLYRLTAKGRAALDSYLGHVEAVIKATRGR
jgi:DNA-binding MarR family transcriptional regulator